MLYNDLEGWDDGGWGVGRRLETLSSICVVVI